MAKTKEDKSFWETWLKPPDWEDIKDPIYGLAKGALLGGLTGGPAGAVAGGYLGAESGSRKRRGEIDQLAAKKAGESDLDRVAQQYYADAMGGASAIGQQMGQSFNRRGLGGSPLAAGIQSQAMNQALGRAQAEVAKMRLGYMTQQDAIKRQEQMQSDQMLYQLLSTIFGVGFRVAEKKGLFDGFLSPSEVDLDYDVENVRTLGGLEGVDPITSVADPNVFGQSSPRLGRGVDLLSPKYDYGDN